MNNICSRCYEPGLLAQCQGCNARTCQDCKFPVCDWCKKVKTVCDGCFLCNRIVTMCSGERVCMSWIITGTLSGEIVYCYTHDNVCPTGSDGICHTKGCDIIMDKHFIRKRCMELFPGYMS